jgi:hypothetical protein
MDRPPSRGRHGLEENDNEQRDEDPLRAPWWIYRDCCVANDLLPRRSSGDSGEDGIMCEKQLLCANAGGRMYYRGRDMAPCPPRHAHQRRVVSAELAPTPAVDDEPRATIMMGLRDAKRRAARLSGRSSRVRSAVATQCDTLASAATAIGAIANRPSSASAPATKTEQIPCRMRGSARPMGTHAERPRFASITDCCRQSSRVI